MLIKARLLMFAAFLAMLTPLFTPRRRRRKVKENADLMDGGWRFHLGDPAGGPDRGAQASGLQWRYKSVPRGEQPSEALAAPDMQWMPSGKTPRPRRTCSMDSGASRGIAPH